MMLPLVFHKSVDILRKMASITSVKSSLIIKLFYLFLMMKIEQYFLQQRKKWKNCNKPNVSYFWDFPIFSGILSLVYIRPTKFRESYRYGPWNHLKIKTKQNFLSSKCFYDTNLEKSSLQRLDSVAFLLRVNIWAMKMKSKSSRNMVGFVWKWKIKEIIALLETTVGHIS